MTICFSSLTLSFIRILTGWEGTSEWTIPNRYTPSTFVSIIIAARNEEKSIKECINSILKSDFPHDSYEIIVIDDASTDNTSQQIKSIQDPRVRCILSNQNIGKKGAISLGIGLANGALIITTDADCIVQKYWLKSLVSYYETSKARLIAAPVQYNINKSLIQRFQYIDCINNMAVTANGILNNAYFMANGANLAYEKTLFTELNGFEGSNDVASGDDMFMIQEAAKLNPSSVRFLKSKQAIVFTQPETSISSLIQQRKRWATKTKTDYMYLAKIHEYFKSKDALKSFLPASIMFLGYIILAAWWAIFPSVYTWKGRTLK